MKKKIIIIASILIVSLLSCCSSDITETTVYSSQLKSSSEETEQRPAVTSQGTPINYDFPLEKYNWQNTEKSTCFSRIAYDKKDNILVVEFRDSGSIYAYYDIPVDVWNELCETKSKGGYYNSDIKGNYYCEKIE